MLPSGHRAKPTRPRGPSGTATGGGWAPTSRYTRTHAKWAQGTPEESPALRARRDGKRAPKPGSKPGARLGSQGDPSAPPSPPPPRGTCKMTKIDNGAREGWRRVYPPFGRPALQAGRCCRVPGGPVTGQCLACTETLLPARKAGPSLRARRPGERGAVMRQSRARAHPLSWPPSGQRTLLRTAQTPTGPSVTSQPQNSSRRTGGSLALRCGRAKLGSVGGWAEGPHTSKGRPAARPPL